MKSINLIAIVICVLAMLINYNNMTLSEFTTIIVKALIQ